MKKFSTKFVTITPKRCVACWKCVDKCPENVICKVGFLWHKHVAFQDTGACIGCRKCVKTCPHGVFFIPDGDSKNPPIHQGKKIWLNVEFLLILLLLATIVTGIKLHVACHGNGQYGQHEWLVAHVISTIAFTLFTVIHIAKRKKFI